MLISINLSTLVNQQELHQKISSDIFSLFVAQSNSEQIHRLTSAIFDSLLSSNISLILPDQIMNLHGLGIAIIDSDAFENLDKPIRTIVLSSNSLSHLPIQVFKSFRMSLINLNLRQNRFNSLNFLHYLEQLRVLDLSKNDLKEISQENFIGLKRLQTLILRENQLTHLSSSTFRSCRKIRTLDLSDNQISHIDPKAFHSLNQLKILLLSNNPLGQRLLTNDFLKPLTNLQYLDLENTQLKNLSPFFLIFNQRLQSIKLRRNYFPSILKRIFCGTSSLIEIDLVGSGVRSLDVCTYHQIPSLRRLYLMNNPLDCTCDLFYLKYGDIHRVLSVNGNIDVHLNRWIFRPELRRHLEKAFNNGDLSRLPIDLSSFARCTTPEEWSGYEINNITEIYNQCRYRWLTIENECRNYCEFKSSCSSLHHFSLFVFLVCLTFLYR